MVCWRVIIMLIDRKEYYFTMPRIYKQKQRIGGTGDGY